MREEERRGDGEEHGSCLKDENPHFGEWWEHKDGWGAAGSTGPNGGGTFRNQTT